MRRIHFIAIGGAAMHNLALELARNGYHVSGSDDEIFEPSRSRLEKAGLLPKTPGWFPAKLTNDIDAVILGMHARADNPELKAAHELGLKIFSYPEFLYEQTKSKKRVVIAGSHGKTTVTSMIMHVLQHAGLSFDYMAGAQIEGFNNMVSLKAENTIAVFEGDEYLSSPIDMRPKFFHYKPHIAVINGIAWDHINVFPTFDQYKLQFSMLLDFIEPGGTVFYNDTDAEVRDIIQRTKRTDIRLEKFLQHPAKNEGDKTFLITGDKNCVPVSLFGEHNLRNIAAAKAVCLSLGIDEKSFYTHISSFKGPAKRLQKIVENEKRTVFLDFAHAPSKVEATVAAVRSKFPKSKLIAIFELHTFSSLNKEFLQGYKNSLDAADLAVVYFNPKVIEHKKLAPILADDIINAFARRDIAAIDDIANLERILRKEKTAEHIVFLFMSSGNFNGLQNDDLINFCTKE